MGVVYRATHEIMRGDFALKIARADLAGDPEVRARFLREAQAAAELRHPNIVETRDPFIEAGQLFLAMELLSGLSLRDALVAEPGPWDVASAVNLVSQAARGLGHAHGRGLVHRDVKPGNLFLREGPQGVEVKVLDFGLARGLGEKSLTAAGMAVGTPVYLPPEVLDGQRATPASDVYALGVVLYRLLTGRLPIDLPPEADSLLSLVMALGRAHLAGLPRVSASRPEVPAWLDAVVARMLARAPGERPADGEAAARALSEGTVEAPDAPEEEPSRFALPTLGAVTVRAAAEAVEAPPAPEADDDASRFGLPTLAPPAPPPAPALDSAHSERRAGTPQAPVSAPVDEASRFGTPATVGPARAEGSSDHIEVQGASPRRRWVVVGVAAVAVAGFAAALGTREPATGPAGLQTAELQWVTISGGTFQMGSTAGDYDEQPLRSVKVASFALSKTEVTVGQYRACVEAGACPAPDTGGFCNWSQSGRDEHPINCVDWGQASAFAKWAGGRLPSEAEWEYAARSGGKAQTYPWGSAKADCSRAVMDDGSGNGCGRGDATWPVCSKPAGNTAQGLCDMAGNVWEWVEDWYGPYGKAPSDGSARTQTAQGRVIRGGSWFDVASDLRAAYRLRRVPGYRLGYLGFRVARSPSP